MLTGPGPKLQQVQCCFLIYPDTYMAPLLRYLNASQFLKYSFSQSRCREAEQRDAKSVARVSQVKSAAQKTFSQHFYAYDRYVKRIQMVVGRNKHVGSHTNTYPFATTATPRLRGAELCKQGGSSGGGGCWFVCVDAGGWKRAPSAGISSPQPRQSGSKPAPGAGGEETSEDPVGRSPQWLCRGETPISDKSSPKLSFFSKGILFGEFPSLGNFAFPGLFLSHALAIPKHALLSGVCLLMSAFPA